jgi:hypothetical protein
MDKPTIEAMMKDLEGRGMVKGEQGVRKFKGKFITIWKAV